MPKWNLPPNLHSEVEGGPICFFHEHGIGSKDGRIPRFSDSCACVRCIAALTEGRLTLDIHKITRKHRRKFLEFWSLVDIRTPDECWEWQGVKRKGWASGHFHIARHWSRSNTHAAQRVATWYTWGDVGKLPIMPICKNVNCCNPLHLRVKGVAHFYHQRKLQVIDLEFNSMKLLRQTQEFLEASMARTPGRFERLATQNEAWIEQRMLGDELDDDDEAGAQESDNTDQTEPVLDLLA